MRKNSTRIQNQNRSSRCVKSANNQTKKARGIKRRALNKPDKTSGHLKRKKHPVKQLDSAEYPQRWNLLPFLTVAEMHSGFVDLL